jgi:hypothetical protein
MANAPVVMNHNGHVDHRLLFLDRHLRPYPMDLVTRAIRPAGPVMARRSPKGVALLLNAEPPLAEIPKDAEHASQSFERLACGLFKTHQITEGSTLG